jgi:hypothetical protein
VAERTHKGVALLLEEAERDTKNAVTRVALHWASGKCWNNGCMATAEPMPEAPIGDWRSLDRAIYREYPLKEFSLRTNSVYIGDKCPTHNTIIKQFIHAAPIISTLADKSPPEINTP